MGKFSTPMKREKNEIHFQLPTQISPTLATHKIMTARSDYMIFCEEKKQTVISLKATLEVADGITLFKNDCLVSIRI